MMFVHVNTTPHSPRRSVRVVESRRTGDRVRTAIVRYVGIALNDAEEIKLKQIAETFIVEEKRARQKQLSLLSEPDEKPKKRRGRPPRIPHEQIAPPSEVSLFDLVEEQRVVEGVHEVAGYVYDSLLYNALFSKRDAQLLKDLVLARLACPASKHQSQKLLAKRFAKVHDLDRIYRLMDKLYEQIDAIKTCTFEKTKSLFPETVDIVFFDVTTLYFESTTIDDLRAFGYSKDHRFNTTQVVLALATNSDGLPIGYELFEGNKAEVSTLLEALTRWKKLFSIQSVCFVGDKAMFSENNLAQLEQRGYQYVIAAKLKKLPNVIQETILDEKHYQLTLLSDELACVSEHSYQDRRLIVSYKQTRAERDQKQRQVILDKISKRLGQNGKTEKLINNHGVKKYTSTDKTARTQLDESKINRDAKWDGFHGVITNIKDLDASHILGRYARLWVIEESFRLNKHTLAMRPIYHFKPERIKAHIALCYMTYATLRHLQYQANLLQKVSVNEILDELLGVQASILVHKKSNQRYRLPGAFSHKASSIYKAFALTRNLNASISS